MALDATIGGTSSDSYCTLAEADTYLEGHWSTKEWALHGETDKEMLLRYATEIMDGLDWLGSVASVTQALALPRDGLFTKNGDSIDSSTIPGDAKKAQAILAFYIGSGDFSEEGTDIDHLNFDGIVLDTKAQKGLPVQVKRLLSHLYIDRDVSVKLVRT